MNRYTSDVAFTFVLRDGKNPPTEIRMMNDGNRHWKIVDQNNNAYLIMKNITDTVQYNKDTSTFNIYKNLPAIQNHVEITAGGGAELLYK